MAQKSDWKLSLAGKESRVVTAINRYLDKLVDWLFNRPPVIDRLIAATTKENLRAIQLAKELEAKKGLENARKYNRDLEAKIKALDKPDEEKDKKPKMRTTRI